MWGPRREPRVCPGCKLEVHASAALGATLVPHSCSTRSLACPLKRSTTSVGRRHRYFRPYRPTYQFSRISTLDCVPARSAAPKRWRPFGLLLNTSEVRVRYARMDLAWDYPGDYVQAECLLLAILVITNYSNNNKRPPTTKNMLNCYY